MVVMILRRIAYNQINLYRSETLRSCEARLTPFRDLLRWVYQTLIAATADDVLTLRSRKVVATHAA